MGEPARNIYDDDNEDAPTSAYDRARKQWGMDDEPHDTSSGGLPSDDHTINTANKAKSSSAEELDGAERAANSPSINAAETAEQQTSSRDNAGWDTHVSSSNNKRAFFSKKQKGIGLAIAGVGAAGVVGLSTIFGPVMIVNQIRELLLTKISQVQVDHSLRYRRRYINRVGDMFTADGRRGGRVIQDMRNRGYDIRFDGDGKMFVKPPGSVDFLPHEQTNSHISDYLEVRHPLRRSRWKTKRMESFYNRYNISGKPVTVRSPNDPEDPEKATNKNIADDVITNDIETNVSQRIADTDETPDEAAARNAEHAATASDTGVFDSIKSKLREGTPISELTPDEQKLLQVTETFDQELIDLIESAASGNIAGRAFKSITSLFNVADVGDKICTVRNRIHGIQVAARTFRAASMLRYASVFIKAGDGTRSNNVSGKTDPKMLNALMKRITSKDSNGNPIGASPGMAYIMKGKFSKSKNDSFKGSFGVDGKLTGFPAVVNDATQIPGVNKSSCRVIQNPGFQVGAGVIAIGAGIFSGGTSAGVTTGFKQAMVAGLRSMVSKRVATSIATGVAIDLSFEGALMLTQFYAEKSSMIPFTGQETGGELGDTIAGGAGTLNKQRSLRAGMVPATTTEYAQSYTTFLAQKREEQQNQSTFTRFFDLNNADSLASQTVTEIAFSPIGGAGLNTQDSLSNLADISRSVMNIPLSTFTNFGKILGAKVWAQTDPDEISFDSIEVGGKSLATDPAGNLLPIMRSNIEEIDPIENLEYLIANNHVSGAPDYEPQSDEFENHVEYCVESEDTLSSIESNSYDCLADNYITKRFKAHLAYIDMLDTIDAGLFPEEINTGTTNNQTSSSAIIPSEGLAWPLIETKAAATASLGSCLMSGADRICHGGHPYLAHDLFAPTGTQVVAATDGEVIKASIGGCGHGFGRAFTVQVYNPAMNATFLYQHMDADLVGVTIGMQLKAGDPIGKVGSSIAACNTLPHLHIDAVIGRGRPTCSRKSCSSDAKSKFIDISNGLYKGYEVLQ